MKTPRRKTWISASIIGALVLPTGCSLGPPGVPHQIAVVVDTHDSQLNSIPQLVAITAMGLDKNGAPGRWFDEGANEWKPYPMKIAVNTPWSHPLTVLPGEATDITLTAVLLGPPGNQLTCAVFLDGNLVIATTQTQIIQAYDEPGTTAGSAVVTCKYKYVNKL